MCAAVAPAAAAFPAAAARHRRHRRHRRRAPSPRVRTRASSSPSPSPSSSSSSSSRITLFGSPGSRSPLVDWYLHELGLDFELRAPSDASNPHPFGQIPALRDDANGVELWESGAILQYLADAYGGLDAPATRADAGKWIVWANASLDPCLFVENASGQVLDSGVRAATPPKALNRLEAVLSKRECLAGEGAGAFGVADVAVASYLLFVPQFFNDASYSRWPNIARYCGRCVIRPAYAKAFGARTAAFLAARLEKDLSPASSRTFWERPDESEAV